MNSYNLVIKEVNKLDHFIHLRIIQWRYGR
jgi:hypothetical protein